MYILIIGTQREILRALSGIQVSLDSMKQEQDNQRRQLSYIMRKLEGSTHVAIEEEMAGTIDLPLASVDEVEKAEEALADKNVRMALVCKNIITQLLF